MSGDEATDGDQICDTTLYEIKTGDDYTAHNQNRLADFGYLWI